MRPHHDLRVWQEAMGLVGRVYRLIEPFPVTETYGLVSQLRRCAVSVPSNIAEGLGRGSPRDVVRFLRMARGSLVEMDTQLRIALMLEMGDPPEIEAALEDGESLLAGLGAYIKHWHAKIL